MNGANNIFVFLQSITEVTQSQAVIMSNETIWEVQTIYIEYKVYPSLQSCREVYQEAGLMNSAGW